jgi:hypothetical protein
MSFDINYLLYKILYVFNLILYSVFNVTDMSWTTYINSMMEIKNKYNIMVGNMKEEGHFLTQGADKEVTGQ